MDEADAAAEHIDAAIIWVEEHGEIDTDDLALLLLASDVLGYVDMRGDVPGRVAWIAEHRALLDALVADHAEWDSAE